MPKEECSGLTKAQEDIRRHSAALGALERGHDELAVTMADLALEQKNMGKQIEEAMERALDRAFDRFADRLQAKAAERTGRWLWGSLKALFTRWALIAFLVLSVGKLAGWQFAVSLLDSLLGKK